MDRLECQINKCFKLENENKEFQDILIEIYKYTQNVEYDVVDIDEIDKILRDGNIENLIDTEKYNYKKVR